MTISILGGLLLNSEWTDLSSNLCVGDQRCGAFWHTTRQLLIPHILNISSKRWSFSKGRETRRGLSEWHASSRDQFDLSKWWLPEWIFLVSLEGKHMKVNRVLSWLLRTDEGHLLLPAFRMALIEPASASCSSVMGSWVVAVQEAWVPGVECDQMPLL